MCDTTPLGYARFRRHLAHSARSADDPKCLGHLTCVAADQRAVQQVYLRLRRHELTCRVERCRFHNSLDLQYRRQLLARAQYHAAPVAGKGTRSTLIWSACFKACAMS